MTDVITLTIIIKHDPTFDEYEILVSRVEGWIEEFALGKLVFSHDINEVK